MAENSETIYEKKYHCSLEFRSFINYCHCSTETPLQSKPVGSPAAHTLLTNGTASGKLSMGPHHYTPSMTLSLNQTQSHYNSLVSHRKILTHQSKIYGGNSSETCIFFCSQKPWEVNRICRRQ